MPEYTEHGRVPAHVPWPRVCPGLTPAVKLDEMEAAFRFREGGEEGPVRDCAPVQPGGGW